MDQSSLEAESAVEKTTDEDSDEQRGLDLFGDKCQSDSDYRRKKSPGRIGKILAGCCGNDQQHYDDDCEDDFGYRPFLNGRTHKKTSRNRVMTPTMTPFQKAEQV